MMKKTIYTLHVLVALFFLICMKTLSLGSESLSKYGNQTRCIAKEREALLLFKQSVANKHDLLNSWKKEKEDCCKWKGVGCDDHTGHVTHLHLSSLISPSYLYSTSISTGYLLLDLEYLNYLDLSSNFLAGIPNYIGSFTNLVHLDLSDTQIEESVPYQIANLSNLQYLNLSLNYNYNGPIPKFIGSLNSLRYLDLSDSYFSGVIPHELGNLSKLQYLDLGNNYYLTDGGNFNWLFNLSSLTHLDLSSINISHPNIWVSFIQRIPSITFMQLEGCNLLVSSSTMSNFSSSISTLRLSGNNINSSIFDWLFYSNSSLVALDLSHNVLEGEIPQSFGHMTALTHLNLGWNIFNGPIPQSFGHMTALAVLDLSHNFLNGPIPNSFGLMTALVYLDVSANKLNGVLSKSISNLSNLNTAYFSSNNFTGNLNDLLSGPFPLLRDLVINENQLTGSLPTITLLASLRYLEVNSNQLNGYLPTIYENLLHLDLSNNHLRGSLPDLTGSSSLESLYLHNNEFSGRVSNFRGFSSLRYLQLSNNELSGSLPDFTGFPQLELLYLNNNSFSGSLPDFTGCSSLEVLQLGENRLTEWNAQSTRLLSSLYELDLSKNNIHSTISEAHMSNLSSLVHMDTSFSSLTFEFSSEWLPPFQLFELSVPSCNLGPKFPIWICNQQGIEHLDISNSQISDTIPYCFSNLSRITELNLSSNNIRGKFSFNFSRIEVMDLSSNSFDGPLPPIPAACSKINLSHNKFSGTLLYISVVEYLSLSFLDISHNQLSGTLPNNWMHFRFLAFLNLGYNNFSGRIPTSVGQLVSLQTLILRNNKLYGDLPASLRNCSRIGFVDFGFNKLSGKIPSWIGKDQRLLYSLILKSNRFYGGLPYGLCHLRNLHFLDLSMNRISGTIPLCFRNLTAMTQKGTEDGEHIYSISSNSTDYYVDDVLARWKGQEFEYGRNFAYLKMIDISSNDLTGEIPIGLTRLVELKGLNLSSNKFYGKVPAEIGQLKGLECLDLSRNYFSGKIPSSMSGLNFLAYLDLSNNNFSGKIPSGTQLQGFSISAYQGNTELCGKPLTNICLEDEPANHVWSSSGEYADDGDDSEYERWLLISAVLGFSTTFWGFIGTLVLNRRWRHAYFLFLGNLKEQFYVAMAVRIARLQSEG